MLIGDFVTTEDGTGLVHTAIAFGEDDFRLGEQYGIKLQNPVRARRHLRRAGHRLRRADRQGRRPRDRRGAARARQAVAREIYEHSYPHCWRCGTPLLYYAKASWYIRTTEVRDRMLAENEKIGWRPEHVKHGRFGKWLEGNVDWALSRERYWGTPLPIWECESADCEGAFCAGSIAELRERGGEVPDDLHRPYIDEVIVPCEDCGGEMRRVEEVIDAWYDSGAMPFAQFHYPFENEDEFEQRFPADYICEAPGPDPRLVLLAARRGGAALRPHQLPQLRLPRPDLRPGGPEDVDEPRQRRRPLGRARHPRRRRLPLVLPQLPAALGRLPVLRRHGRRVAAPASCSRSGTRTRSSSSTRTPKGSRPDDLAEAPLGDDDLDRWALSRLQGLTATVIDRMDDFDCTTAGRAIAEYVDELSNWYVRLNRRRFWEGDRAAFATLRHCLIEVSKLLAPFIPFVADEIHDNLAGGADSVHLRDYPEPDPELADGELEAGVEAAMRAIELGRAARAQAEVKNRQPLRRAVIVATEAERRRDRAARPSRRRRAQRQGARVRLRGGRAGRLRRSSPTTAPSGRASASAMPQVAAAVEALDPDHVAEATRGERRIGINIDGTEHTLEPDDFTLVMSPLEGYEVEAEAGRAVALSLELDDELRREGLAREIVHAIQSARKQAGLDVSDRIELTLGGDEELLEAARAHEGYVAGETLATSITYDGDGSAQAASIEGRELRIGIEREG